MKLYPFCDPYVWENPKVLLSTGFTVKSHKEGPCASEYVNHVILIYTLAILFGMILSLFVNNAYVVTICIGLATVYCAPTLWTLVNMQRIRESFTDSDEPARVYDVIGGGAPATLTLPTAINPFMNILLDEIKYNPTRPTAMSVMDPSVKVTLDEFFRTQFTNDPTDVFGKTQSQRQFITMPSTGIPNDQESFQNWLYKIPGKTCKEGGREACLPGTDGGTITWLNVNS
jgi:hypothetical protein